MNPAEVAPTQQAVEHRVVPGSVWVRLVEPWCDLQGRPQDTRHKTMTSSSYRPRSALPPRTHAEESAGCIRPPACLTVFLPHHTAVVPDTPPEQCSDLPALVLLEV
ncbi:unnamed protein product [Gadus morhua 'NCC']